MPFAEFGAKIVKAGKSNFVRQVYDVAQEDRVLETKTANCNNVDVYRSIFTYEDNNLGSSRIRGPLYFDFDLAAEGGEEMLQAEVRAAVVNLQRIFSLTASDIKVYFSGHKGFHVIVPQEIFGSSFSDYALLTKTYHAVALILVSCWHEFKPGAESCLDLKIYDHRRMFRLPDSVNSKSGLYKIEIPVSYLRHYSFSDIRKFATQPSTLIPNTVSYNSTASNIMKSAMKTVESSSQTENKGTRERKKIDKILPCIENILSASVSEGKRNNVAVALASALFQLQLSSDNVIDTMQEWNDNNDPPLSDDELLKVIMSAKRMDDKEMYYGCTGIRDIGFCDNSCKIIGHKR